MSAAARDRSRVRLEESAVEIQAGAKDAQRLVDGLTGYDRRENDRHLSLMHADERTAEILVGQLIAGDVWEAEQLRTLRDRVTSLSEEGYRLAGDITRFLELRGQRELFSVERA